MLELQTQFLSDVAAYCARDPDPIPLHCPWFECTYMQVRLSNCLKQIEGEARHVIAVTNVEVFTYYQGRKIYSDFLAYLERVSGRTVFIQSVIERKQLPLYYRRGYVNYGDINQTACVYKTVPSL